MADYYSLLARAVAALPQSSPESRQAVYERARKALFNQLRGIQPPVAEADIAAEGRALEEAIARLEIEIAAKAAQPPQPAPAAGPQQQQAPRQQQRAAETAPAPRDAETAWRDSLAATTAPADTGPREPQRPAAPLPPLPEPPRASRSVLAVAALLVALIAVFGMIAWQMREKPEDLAKLKPQDSAAEGAEAKIDDRIEGAETAPKPAAAKPATSVAVAQKAEMWVASLQQPDKVDKIYNATVIWRLDNVGGVGEQVGSAVRGDVDIPDAKMKATLVFRKNTDQTLSASHTINVSFNVAPGSPLGGVKAIGPIQMRRPEAQSGEKIAGIPVPITDNNFLIGLMRGDQEKRNMTLLQTLAVLDLPLQLNDGRAATISMEKGPTGERVFADAIQAWAK